jgi:hypothetical protein
MGTSYNPKIVTDGLVLNLDPANVKSYPANQDPFVNNVSLMLDGESLTDKSQNSVAVTVEGSVIVDSSFKKVGNSSLKFGGALADCLTVPSSSLFAFPGDFTIEFWTYANQFGQRSGATVYFCNGVLNQFQLALLSATQINLYLNGSSFITGSLSASAVGRWMHIALVRSGSTIRIYENGTSVGSGTSSYSVPASICYIGKQLPRSPTNYGHNLDGYIDDLKITKGARYTANFTPPTAPLSLPGVVTDLTKNKINSTLIAGPTYSSTNGGSLLFDGGTQYINIGSNSNLILGTNDFALELWFKPVSRAQSYPFLLHNQIGAGSAINCWQINDRHGNNPTLATFWCYNYNAFSSSMLASASAISNENWYHLVITRIGNIFSMYLNSVLQSTVTSSISVDGGASMNYGFNTTGQGGFNGNSSIIKVYKGKGFTNNEILQNFNATKGRFGL